MKSEEESPAFSCRSCGRSFRWSAKIAGRKAKCGCGEVIAVPTAPPAPAPESSAAGEASGASEEDNPFGFDVVDGAEPAPMQAPPVHAAPAAAVPRAVLPVEVPRPAKAAAQRSQAIAYQRAKSERARALDAGLSVWGHPDERRTPLIMLCVSTAIVLGLLVYQYGDPLEISIYFVIKVIQIAVMIGAAAATASFMGISFGVLGLAVIRFGAVYTTYDAITLGLLAVSPGLAGAFFGSMIGLIFLIVALMRFFQLTLFELFMLGLISLGLRWLISIVLMAIAFAILQASR